MVAVVAEGSALGRHELERERERERRLRGMRKVGPWVARGEYRRVERERREKRRRGEERRSPVVGVGWGFEDFWAATALFAGRR